MPTSNDEIDIQTLVIEDMGKRRELGIRRYGTALQPFNGRDALRDAYEEALDLATYLRQIIEEQYQRRERVWQVIKNWDIQRTPGAGYAGATGTDLAAIIKALDG